MTITLISCFVFYFIHLFMKNSLWKLVEGLFTV